MKRIFLLAFIAISLIGCAQDKKEEKKNDLHEAKLKGKVKSVRGTVYYAVEKFGEIQKGGISSVQDSYIYNEQGNKIEGSDYNSDGSLYEKITFKYDANGNKIEGNVYKSDGSHSKKGTFKYDANGNQIERNVYKSDGSLVNKSTYKYDAKGNQIEENWYDSDGSLGWKNTYKYDANGNQIEENMYNSDGSLSLKITCKYDANGNQIERNWYYSDGSFSKYTYKYEFDTYGNWIKKIEYQDDKPNAITEREIEYY